MTSYCMRHLYICVCVRVCVCVLHGLLTCIADERYVNWTLQVASVHGQKAALPFIESVEVNSYAESLSACILLYPHF